MKISSFSSEDIFTKTSRTIVIINKVRSVVEMQISFIRSGQLDMQNETMTITEFQTWMEAYGNIDIIKGDMIPRETIKVIQGAKLVVSSDSKQAVQSAVKLTESLSFIQSSLFREAVIPSHFPVPKWLKCRHNTWVIFGRVLWVMGYSKGVESYGEAKLRAKQAADTLIGYATVFQRIVLVGHGYFNMLIGLELRARGWNGLPTFQVKPWGCTVYTFHKAIEGDMLKATFT